MNLLDIKPHSVTEGVLGKHFLIYGTPGTWKTTVASKFPKALFLATEIGYSFIPGVKAQDISSWYEFKMALSQLEKAEVRAAYDTVVIDTASLLIDMAEKYVCNKLGVDALGDAGWGKGWNEFKKELSSTFNLIAQKGYGIVFIAHAKEVRNSETGSLQSATPDLPNIGLKTISALADFIIYLNKESDESGEAVYGYVNFPIREDLNILTKTRVPGMPQRFKFLYDNLNNLIVNAISELDVEITNEVKERITFEDSVTLEQAIEMVQKSASKAMELGMQFRVQEILAEGLKGVSLTDATEAHKGTLLAINQAFIDLAKGN